jgi:hypothetical protein
VFDEAKERAAKEMQAAADAADEADRRRQAQREYLQGRLARLAVLLANAEWEQARLLRLAKRGRRVEKLERRYVGSKQRQDEYQRRVEQVTEELAAL